MFIGHYGVALACKRWTPRVPLWVLFLAVQLADVVFALLLVFGVEKMRIVPGFTATNSYDLYFMPYSHGLVGALAWSLVAGHVARGVYRAGPRATACALSVAVAVLSHFVLDLVVHTPDLPLVGDDSSKLGLGLWNYPLLSGALELALLYGGLALWLAPHRPLGVKARKRVLVATAILTVLTIATPLTPPPPGLMAMAGQLLFFYVVLCGLAAWTERSLAGASAANASG